MTRTNPLVLAWTPSPEWMDTAACRDAEPDVFFRKDPSAAKATCAVCTVVDTCLRYAIDNNIEAGTWGAQSEDERKGLRQPQ